MMIRVGIVGGAGYTGGELIRILLNHPQAEIVSVQSRSQAGKRIEEVHRDLLGQTALSFADDISFDTDVLFLCMGHGESKKLLDKIDIPEHIKIIDLSQDFRYGAGFVYGLPEVYREEIKGAVRLANPGCFATSIQMGLLPLAASGKLDNEIHVSGITGSTGAGQKLAETGHFSWRESNVSIYKAFTHQHLVEIGKTLSGLQGRESGRINFLPFRGNFTRGIYAAIYTKSDYGIDEAYEIYEQYFQSHPFVHISRKNPNLKQVVNTNNVILYLEKQGDILLVISMIDNLLKGASGQAVQNMNLMFGIEEESGLRLKASYF
jgi:N-acetyl-gamma-glutamyl-phosphate reductase